MLALLGCGTGTVVQHGHSSLYFKRLADQARLQGTGRHRKDVRRSAGVALLYERKELGTTVTAGYTQCLCIEGKNWAKVTHRGKPPSQRAKSVPLRCTVTVANVSQCTKPLSRGFSVLFIANHLCDIILQ